MQASTMIFKCFDNKPTFFSCAGNIRFRNVENVFWRLVMLFSEEKKNKKPESALQVIGWVEYGSRASATNDRFLSILFFFFFTCRGTLRGWLESWRQKCVQKVNMRKNVHIFLNAVADFLFVATIIFGQRARKSQKKVFSVHPLSSTWTVLIFAPAGERELPQNKWPEGMWCFEAEGWLRARETGGAAPWKPRSVRN